MKVDLKAVLGFRGVNLKDTNSHDLTLKEILIQGLLSDEAGLSQEDRYKRWQLVKCLEDDRQDFSVEEVVIMKASIKGFSTVAQGLAIDLLEGEKSA